LQPKLLRVIQDGEFERLGSSRTSKIDVRIIAATHQDLDSMVAEGRFRDDLLYRLRVIEIEVPPLRNRREDVLPLARHLLAKLARKLNLPRLQLDVACVDYLQSYQWPGNVRELENALERAAVFSRDGIIMPEHLPPHIIAQIKLHVKSSDPLTRSLAEVESEHILAVLNSSGGNKTRTAEILGIGSATLWRRLKEIERKA